MEMTDAYARELEKQERRKNELKKTVSEDLAGAPTIVFEAGCGHGHWLADFAAKYPEKICVGIDLITWRIRKGLEKREKRGLSNLHFYKAELSEFLEILPEDLQIELTILLFPDPWPKARHHRRRMVQTTFLDEIAKRTASGGRFCFRSDDRPYYEWAVEHLSAHPEWEINESVQWPHETETYFQDLMDEYYSIIALRK